MSYLLSLDLGHYPCLSPGYECIAVCMEGQASSETVRTRKSTSMKRASGGSKTPIRLKISSAAVPAPLQTLILLSHTCLRLLLGTPLALGFASAQRMMSLLPKGP